MVYDEYRCVYGEETEAALRFLFNAMAPKPEPELPFQGIPAAIYMDNGPVSRSKVFQSVMGSLAMTLSLNSAPHCERDNSPENCEIEITPEMIDAGAPKLRRQTMPKVISNFLTD